jgi:sporulation protein YlmC with PRC-barrel domain
MENWSAGDFHLGAAVHSSDGKVVGNLARILVDAADYGLKALVVKESRDFAGALLSPGSMLLTDEVIVPKDAIKVVARDRIELKLSSADARRLPPYLSYRFESESRTEELADIASVITSNPAVPGSWEEVANKSEGDLEIESGESVRLRDGGKKLGTVKDILFDGDQLVGIVLQKGLLREEVILPRRFLTRSDDLALFAELGEEDLKHLRPFQK